MIHTSCATTTRIQHTQTFYTHINITHMPNTHVHTHTHHHATHVHTYATIPKLHTKCTNHAQSIQHTYTTTSNKYKVMHTMRNQCTTNKHKTHTRPYTNTKHIHLHPHTYIHKRHPPYAYMCNNAQHIRNTTQTCASIQTHPNKTQTRHK